MFVLRTLFVLFSAGSGTLALIDISFSQQGLAIESSILARESVFAPNQILPRGELPRPNSPSKQVPGSPSASLSSRKQILDPGSPSLSQQSSDSQPSTSQKRPPESSPPSPQPQMHTPGFLTPSSNRDKPVPSSSRIFPESPSAKSPQREDAKSKPRSSLTTRGPSAGQTKQFPNFRTAPPTGRDLKRTNSDPSLRPSPRMAADVAERQASVQRLRFHQGAKETAVKWDSYGANMARGMDLSGQAAQAHNIALLSGIDVSAKNEQVRAYTNAALMSRLAGRRDREARNGAKARGAMAEGAAIHDEAKSLVDGVVASHSTAFANSRIVLYGAHELGAQMAHVQAGRDEYKAERSNRHAASARRLANHVRKHEGGKDTDSSDSDG